MALRRNLSIFKSIIIGVALLGLGACSSVTKGTTQNVYVDTRDVREAKCTLQNEKGSWTVHSTPGIADVDRGGGDLRVTCEKENYHDGEMSVAQGFEPMTLGNALIGGLIGLAVDAASGAAFDYPTNISVLLTPLNPTLLKKDPLEADDPKDDSTQNQKLSNSDPVEETIYVEAFQGTWTGYRGEGCFDLGSWPVDITINAHVKGNLLRLAITHKNIFNNDPGTSLYGMDKFTEVRKLDFDPDYNTVKVISVNADTTTNRLSVLFDGKCEVKLRKTGKQVIADNFKGKRASNTAINVSKDMTNTVQPVETDFSPLNGNWKGFAGSGCVYFMANPADVTVRASIRDNTFKMQLSHQYNFGSDRGKGLRAEDKLPSHGELIFDPEYNEVNFVKVKADPVRRNVSIHFNPGCTVNLQRTDEKTIPDGFRGKKATTKKAEYFS